MSVGATGRDGSTLMLEGGSVGDIIGRVRTVEAAGRRRVEASRRGRISVDIATERQTRQSLPLTRTHVLHVVRHELRAGNQARRRRERAMAGRHRRHVVGIVESTERNATRARMRLVETMCVVLGVERVLRVRRQLRGVSRWAALPGGRSAA